MDTTSSARFSGCCISVHESRRPFVARTTVRIGTRGSPLALVQTRLVHAALAAAHPDTTFAIETITTTGDAVRDVPLHQIGGAGAFTKELEQALRAAQVDVAVHSLKDLPTTVAEGLCVGAVPGREDARDALVSGAGGVLAALPHGAAVGTSSVRRKAQLLAQRPDLRISDIRGNVDTRLRKVRDGEYDATVLAFAGLRRLDREAEVSEVLPFEVMLPAPGQGALGVECRDEPRWRRLLAPIHDAEVAACVHAERAFLDACGGGCSVPVGAHAEVGAGVLTLRAVVVAVDGSATFAGHRSGDPAHAETMGRELAASVLAEGAAEIIDGVLRSRAT